MIKSIKSFLARIAPYAVKAVAIVTGYFAAKATEVMIFDAVGTVITLTEGSLLTTVVSAASFIVPAVLAAVAVILAYTYGTLLVNKLIAHFRNKKSQAPAVAPAPAAAA